MSSCLWRTCSLPFQSGLLPESHAIEAQNTRQTHAGMSQSLEERLRANSSAFDGLLALIPAKYYYDDKTQDQWKAKKKSKKQVREDKLKKLDPDQQDEETGSALAAMQKKQKTAKPVRLPGEKFKQLKKLQEQNEDEDEEDEDEDEDESSQGVVEREDINIIFDDDGNEVRPTQTTTTTTTSVESNDGNATTTPETRDSKQENNKEKQEQRKKNLEALRSKLQSKIQDMKAKRKAPGSKVNGAPSSREAILAQRKRRDELKRMRKEQRQQESDSDNSDNSDTSDVEDAHQNKKTKTNKHKDINADDVMFQSIVFDDGDRATSDLQRLRRATKKKGPAKNDLKAHLKLLETKKTKFQSKDELDQIKDLEKQKWQKAMLQAEGVKLKDDEKLLRKAIKRKEAQKRKSSLEWKDRQRAVEQNKQEKAKRREENLKIRKENKGVKRSKQQKMKRKFKGAAVPKKRAGFEGRLKSGKKK